MMILGLIVVFKEQFQEILANTKRRLTNDINREISNRRNESADDTS